MKKVVILDGKAEKTIDPYAFEYCEALSDVEMPNSVVSIGKNAFKECSNLTGIKIPNKVKQIEDFTFYQCSNLKKAEMSNGVTSIGEQAFFNCEELNSIKMSKSLTAIGNEAFYGCRKLTSIEVPYNVESIGHSAFQECENLKSIEISPNVQDIGYGAFYNCSDDFTLYVWGKDEKEKWDKEKEKMGMLKNNQKIVAIPCATFNANDGKITDHYFEYEYDDNGNEKAVNKEKYVQIKKEKIEEGKVKLPDNPVREGYTFEGWYTDKEFTKKFDSEARLTDDIYLYAKWKSNDEAKDPESQESDENKDNESQDDGGNKQPESQDNNGSTSKDDSENKEPESLKDDEDSKEDNGNKQPKPQNNNENNSSTSQDNSENKGSSSHSSKKKLLNNDRPILQISNGNNNFLPLSANKIMNFYEMNLQKCNGIIVKFQENITNDSEDSINGIYIEHTALPEHMLKINADSFKKDRNIYIYKINNTGVLQIFNIINKETLKNADDFLELPLSDNENYIVCDALITNSEYKNIQKNMDLFRNQKEFTNFNKINTIRNILKFSTLMLKKDEINYVYKLYDTDKYKLVKIIKEGGLNNNKDYMEMQVAESGTYLISNKLYDRPVAQINDTNDIFSVVEDNNIKDVYEIDSYTFNGYVLKMQDKEMNADGNINYRNYIKVECINTQGNTLKIDASSLKSEAAVYI